MRRPLIGITCGTSSLDHQAKNPQDRLNHAYSRAVALAGGIPVILPNAGAMDSPDDVLDRLDGLLLSGGYDVAPGLFGEERLNDSVEIDGPRDEAEMPLIRAAVERDIPILAICRGVQILNVALGGTLIQDLPSQSDTRIRHRQECERHEATHGVSITAGSRLREIIGMAELDVNSFHHQSLKGVAEGLAVAATAADGVVEAVERSPARFLVGVQWHPEEMVEVSDGARRLFESFVSAAAGD